MSDISTTAKVTLAVNGEQAKKMIDDLKTGIDGARKELERLEKAKANPKDIEKARKNVRELEKQLREAQSATEGVRNVLQNLDKVSLRELEKTLKTLNKQFKDAKQGSEAYEILAERIRTVKEQISSVRDELQNAPEISGWSKFFDWADKIWPAFDIASRTYHSAVSAMKEYVDAFAGMDQEMASVSKYTGMATADVNALNEEFKKMDTRTSREDLNRLAQEAGRLGKQSVEDVMGFVRAADKINVALDDLGDGATLTLSKLTGIFGDEERLGTEKALLSVGSVINELSQNCSASAPYIAEFASRLGGVGAQAKMTSQQIMAYAAVMDANNQKVEASSTALSQIIVRLYQDPAKYAKVAGMDVKKFSELVKTDMNAALLEFLDTLSKAGGMDALSPMFKDMGENGSRAISALSTLAANIDTVRSQQEVANQAFSEAVSIDKEFAVQNNTSAASLDKCKNAAHELQVELGQQLYPLMIHMLNSGRAVVSGITTTVKFLLEYKKAIIVLTTSILAYTAAANASAIATKSMTLWTAAVTKAKAAWQAFSIALKANPIGLAVAAVTALVGALVSLKMKTDEYKKSMDAAMKSATSFAEESRREIKEIDTLFGKLDAAKKGTEQYKKAKDEIISKYSVYLKGLINEKGEITNLAEAYERLTFAAQKSAQARGIASAKDSLNSAFYQEVDETTEKIRKRLEQLGMNERDLTRIITSISQAMASGNDIPIETRREIMAFERANNNWYDGMIGRDSAMGLVHDLRRKQTDNKTRNAKLDSMDNRFFQTMSDDDLQKQIDAIRNSMTGTLAPSGGNLVQVKLDVSGDAKKTFDKVVDIYGGKASLPSNKPLATGDSKSTLEKYDVKPPSADDGNVYLSKETAQSVLKELMYEQSQRAASSASGESLDTDPSGGYTSTSLSEKERKKQEREAKAAAAKEKAEFKKGLDDIKGMRAKAETEAMADRSAGLINYSEYIERMREAEVKYYEDASEHYKKYGLEEDEDHLTLLKKKQEADDKYCRERVALNKEAIERIAAIEERDIEARHRALENPTLSDDLAYKEELLTLRYNKLMDLQKLLKEFNLQGSKEWEEYEMQLQDLLHADQTEKQKLFMEKVAEFQKKFDKMSVAEKYKLEYDALETLYKNKKISEEQYRKWLKGLQEQEKKELPGQSSSNSNEMNAQAAMARYAKQKKELNEAKNRGQIDEKEYEIRLRRIGGDLRDNLIEPLKNAKSEWVSLMTTMIDSWMDFADAIKGNNSKPLESLQKGIEATAAVMSASFAMATQFIEADLKIQTAAIEKRYDKEIKLAEGNSYRVAKLEKEKEDEIAKRKNEANRKMFAMQVVQAVAQTATNALNAYGSAAAIPVVGHVLAPIAAAMAVAAGAVQIAAIKKQQQASEAQGYSKGGFTKKGAVNEPAGVVHAGEWVASQKLLANPVARPLIEALDYAQRTNTIGRLRAEDVSRSITAPETVSRIADGSPSAAVVASVLSSNADVIDRLTQRLEEPFVTINTVTGDAGSKKAQDDYLKLMRNKAPKSRKNANIY